MTEIIFALVDYQTDVKGLSKNTIYTLRDMVLHIEDAYPDVNKEDFDEVMSLFNKQYTSFKVTKMIGMPYDAH